MYVSVSPQSLKRSSLLEADNIRQILYGIPLPPSQVGRLARLGQRLGPGSISVLIDDIAQLAAAKSFQAISEFPLSILIKVDTGYHRAGLPTGTAGFRSLVQAILELESHKHGLLAGFYSHAGHSYGTNSSTLAMEILIKEIESLELAAAEADQLRLSEPRNQRYTLSVGATPTATSIESLVGDSREPTAEKLQYLVRRIQENHSIELHAGVYPYLDMQQLATHASPSAAGDLMNPRPPICHADLALTILVEVASVYESRDELEVLIAAGTLALGREPCKSYSGWGVVSNWGMKAPYSVGECGWKVGRISQEHGILTKHLDNNEDRSALLRVGQKLRIWPNHACVAGAGFSWYLVVDSSLSESRQDEIVDVWIRCRGW